MIRSLSGYHSRQLLIISNTGNFQTKAFYNPQGLSNEGLPVIQGLKLRFTISESLILLGNELFKKSPDLKCEEDFLYLIVILRLYSYKMIETTHTSIKTSIKLQDPNIIRTAEIAKALGHPARVAILKILAGQNTCFCGDITEILPLAQSTISQHLKALKKAGLISGEVDGVRTCYCLKPDGIQDLNDFLSKLSSDLMSTCC